MTPCLVTFLLRQKHYLSNKISESMCRDDIVDDFGGCFFIHYASLFIKIVTPKKLVITFLGLLLIFQATLPDPYNSPIKLNFSSHFSPLAEFFISHQLCFLFLTLKSISQGYYPYSSPSIRPSSFNDSSNFPNKTRKQK